MFWGIVSSVLSVFNTFAYQKAIAEGVSMNASPLFRSFFNNVIAALIIIVLAIVFFPFTASVPLTEIDFSPYGLGSVIFLSILASSASTVANVAGQYAYSNEQARVLAPYSETGRLFTIVAGFFIFSGSSPATFASAVVAIVAIIAFSVDFRSFSMNRYCAILAGSGILRAVSSLSIGYVALHATPFTITFFDVSFSSALWLWYLFWKKGFPPFDKEKFRRLVTWTSVNDWIWIVTFVISLLLLKDLGIVATSLLGMLSLVLTIAFDSIRLRSMPAPKLSALAFIVAASVVAGSVFH